MPYPPGGFGGRFRTSGGVLCKQATQRLIKPTALKISVCAKRENVFQAGSTAKKTTQPRSWIDGILTLTLHSDVFFAGFRLRFAFAHLLLLFILPSRHIFHVPFFDQLTQRNAFQEVIQQFAEIGPKLVG
jgi:hypothetical protein